MTVITEPVTWISPAVPDQELLAAIGELVVVHVHLDHMLKMTIKSLLGITVDEALRQLSRKGPVHLRQQVEKAAVRKFGAGPVTEKLSELLERCREVTERRNYFAKNVYVEHLSEPNVGRIALLDSVDQVNRPLPSVASVRATTEAIDALVADINHARLKGWLYKTLTDAGQVPD